MTYGFDNAARLTSMEDWANRITTYAYYPDGYPQLATSIGNTGQRTTTAFGYDNARRVIGVDSRDANGGMIGRSDYQLDPAGNRMGRSEWLGIVGGYQPLPGTPAVLPAARALPSGTAATQVLPTARSLPSGTAATKVLPDARPVLNGGQTMYAYDNLRQLTGAANHDGSQSDYELDPVGNRESLIRAGTTTTYAYDGADRLTSASTGGTSTSYGADANGNRTGKGTGTFAFDQANRMTSATVTGGTATYAYDGDGKRVSKTVPGSGGGTTSYLYDINRSLPAVLQDSSRRYVWGLGLAYATTTNGATVQGVYHGDGLGSTRALTDGAGVLTDPYQTDECGIPGTGAGTSTQPFGYTGQMRDAETGLVNLRAGCTTPRPAA